MRIQYQKGDPRHGAVVEMEANRAKQLIESGAAKKVGPDVESEPVAAQSLRSATKAVRKGAAKKASAKKGDDGKPAE